MQGNKYFFPQSITPMNSLQFKFFNESPHKTELNGDQTNQSQVKDYKKKQEENSLLKSQAINRSAYFPSPKTGRKTKPSLTFR